MIIVDSCNDVNGSAEDVEYIVNGLEFGKRAELLVNQTKSTKKL